MLPVEKEVFSEELLKIIQSLLPKMQPRRFMYPGKEKVEDSKALAGKLFLLIIAIGWE